MSTGELRLVVEVEPGKGSVAARTKVYDGNTGMEYTNIFGVEEIMEQGVSALMVTFAARLEPEDVKSGSELRGDVKRPVCIDAEEMLLA